jgi:glyoxylase-like metal-dependent hydrolase (beta-lactamase superfamily II)
MSFGIVGTESLLTGDHVMGWNSTLVAVPDGSMRDYLRSLETVIALPYRRYLPAHGGPIADGPSYARALLTHRMFRNSQIIAAVTDGARTVGELLGRIYPQLTGKLRLAAAMTLRAHLEYLNEEGAITLRRLPFGLRLAPP